MKFKEWFLKEDGDLNGWGMASPDDDPGFRRQTTNPNADIEYDKTLNLKRRLKKLNFCKKQKKN